MALITVLLKKHTNPSPKQEQTMATNDIFQRLKHTFVKVSILYYFNPKRLIMLQTDACSFAITGTVNQYDSFRVLRPIAFYSTNYNSAKQNYDTYNHKLLAIVRLFKHYRHYLKGARHVVLVCCNYKNLKYLC